MELPPIVTPEAWEAARQPAPATRWPRRWHGNHLVLPRPDFLGRLEDWEDSPPEYRRPHPTNGGADTTNTDGFPGEWASQRSGAQNGRVTSTTMPSTATGATRGSHGTCHGSDTAANPSMVKPTAPITVGPVVVAACRSTR